MNVKQAIYLSPDCSSWMMLMTFIVQELRLDNAIAFPSFKNLGAVE